jgi:hypothetical protein
MLFALASPRYWAALFSTISPSAFLLQQWLRLTGGLLSIAVLVTLLVPLTIALWWDGFPELPGPRTWFRALLKPWQFAASWRDALLAQFAILGILLLVFSLDTVFSHLCSTPATTDTSVKLPTWLLQAKPLLSSVDPGHGITFFSNLDVALPVVNLIVLAVLSGLCALLGWLFLLALGKRMSRNRIVTGCCLAAVIVSFLCYDNADWTDVLRKGFGAIVGLGGLWLVYRLALRTNPLALFITGFVTVLGVGISDLLWFPAYRAAAITIGALVLLAFIVAFLSALFTRQDTVMQPAAAEVTEQDTFFVPCDEIPVRDEAAAELRASEDSEDESGLPTKTDASSPPA